MKITGRVRVVSVEGERWSAQVSGRWVSQFLTEKITAELRAALEDVKKDETWEFECVEATAKTGRKYLNVVGAARTPDHGQDEGPASSTLDKQESPDTAVRIARSVAVQVSGPFLAELIKSGIVKDADVEAIVVMARRLEHFINTGE